MVDFRDGDSRDIERRRQVSAGCMLCMIQSLPDTSSEAHQQIQHCYRVSVHQMCVQTMRTGVKVFRSMLCLW